MSKTIVLAIVLLRLTFDHALTELDERRQNALEFWIDTICYARTTKMIHLYGINTNESDSLFLFHNGLVRGLQEKCETTLFLTKYSINSTQGKGNEDIYGQNMKDADGFPKVKPFLTNHIQHSEKVTHGVKREKKIYDIWSLNVILTKDESSIEQILNRRTPLVDWTPRLHFVVLLITDDACVESEKYKAAIQRILKAFWSSRRILNVLLFVPLAKNGESVMYAYDPFVWADEEDNERGKVESTKVVSKEDIFQQLSTLTHRRTNNMHGYRLNVAVFEQFQSLMKMNVTPRQGSIYEYSAGYNGLNGIVLGTVAKYMNFKVNAIQPSDDIIFGHELPNGTYVGTLGDLVYGRADVAFASFFVKSYGKSKQDFEFTKHSEYDSICVFVPKARKIPKWLRIHHMFEPSIWFCSIISPIIVYLMCLILRLVTTRRITSSDRGKFAYKVFQFTVGYPAKLPYSSPERILLFTLSILNVTIAGLFGGLLYKSLAHDMYYKDIDRLVDLAASDLPIVFSKYNLNDVFGDEHSDSPLLASLKKKLKQGLRSMEDATEFRNASGFIRRRHYYLVKREMVDQEGSSKLHLVKECPGTYYLGYPLPKNSYLLEKLDLLIGRLDQAGLLTLWANRTIINLVYQRGIAAKNMPSSSANGFVPFKLTDMQTAFYLLAVGFILSSIIFCKEKDWFKRQSKRKGDSFFP